MKKAISEATSNDAVAEIMCQLQVNIYLEGFFITSKSSYLYMIASLQSAIREERYHDASRLCNETGSGLVSSTRFHKHFARHF